MTSIITVRDYKDFLECTDESLLYEKHFMDTYTKITATYSAEERFKLAKKVMSELNKYGKPNVFGKIYWGQKETLITLTQSFVECENISHKEFIQILNKANLATAKLLIQNKIFPVDILVDSSFFERYKSHPEYSFLENTIQHLKSYRFLEIIDYYRNIVPESENMSDEMVLKVAGVEL